MSAPPPTPEERLQGLVHDLRTPLTVITGFAQLLERSQADGSLTEQQRADYVVRIAEAAAQLGEILDREQS